jgi:hypothetical protein
LAPLYNGNSHTVVTVAIDRMYARETAERSIMHEHPLNVLAEAIYTQVFGHLDDKYFSAVKIQEIYDWLEAGDDGEDRTVADLATEWREYDADDVEANRP